MKPRKLDPRLARLCLFLPLLFPILVPEYDFTDLANFGYWAQHLAADPRHFYVNTSFNYPFVGLLASVGVMSLFEHLHVTAAPESLFEAFRFYLSLVDFANAWLIYHMMRALGARAPLFAAFLIMALPSSWVGGAVWGQIDGVTQFFVLASALCFVRAARARPAEAATAGLAWFASGCLALAGGILCKQLFVFSLPGLALLALVAAAGLRRDGVSRGKLSAVAACAVALLFAPDLYFKLPAAEISHLQTVFFDARFRQDNVIAGNGFNVWLFLGRDMWSSSTVPFLGPVTPHAAGFALFGAFGAVLAWAIARPLRRALRDPRPELLVLLIFFTGLVNLGMNVWLTDTHERYLFHGYPLLLASVLLLAGRRPQWLSRTALAVTIAGACLYGSFVYSILQPGWLDWAAWLKSHLFVAAFHLAALGLLTADFLINCLN